MARKPCSFLDETLRELMKIWNLENRACFQRSALSVWSHTVTECRMPTGSVDQVTILFEELAPCLREHSVVTILR